MHLDRPRGDRGMMWRWVMVVVVVLTASKRVTVASSLTRTWDHACVNPYYHHHSTGKCVSA